MMMKIVVYTYIIHIHIIYSHTQARARARARATTGPGVSYTRPGVSKHQIFDVAPIWCISGAVICPRGVDTILVYFYGGRCAPVMDCFRYVMG